MKFLIMQFPSVLLFPRSSAHMTFSAPYSQASSAKLHQQNSEDIKTNTKIPAFITSYDVIVHIVTE
jgi:hypothetical protein